MDKKKCIGCENEFVPLKSNQRYCSVSCRSSTHYQRNKDKIREKNRERYWANDGYREQRAISRKKYQEKIKQINAIYHDKTRFGGNREKALIRDDYTCQLCSSKEMLDVHHLDKSGSSENPNNDLSNLITLCKPCHQKQHKHDKPKTGEYINCLHCGKQTFALKKEIGRKKYCSVECADKDKVGKLKTSVIRQCEVCGNDFKATAQSIELGKGKYCSVECSSKSQRKRIKVNCLHCGTEFEEIPSRIKAGKGKYCSKDCYHKSKAKKTNN